MHFWNNRALLLGRANTIHVTLLTMNNNHVEWLFISTDIIQFQLSMNSPTVTIPLIFMDDFPDGMLPVRASPSFVTTHRVFPPRVTRVTLRGRLGTTHWQRRTTGSLSRHIYTYRNRRIVQSITGDKYEKTSAPRQDKTVGKWWTKALFLSWSNGFSLTIQQNKKINEIQSENNDPSSYKSINHKADNEKQNRRQVLVHVYKLVGIIKVCKATAFELSFFFLANYRRHNQRHASLWRNVTEIAASMNKENRLLQLGFDTR